jgi:hypothetical protein
MPARFSQDDRCHSGPHSHICETTAGVDWYIIEYESDAYPPLVSVEKTLQIMRRWGKC